MIDFALILEGRVGMRNQNIGRLTLMHLGGPGNKDKLADSFLIRKR
jgi:hypothetical protein